MKASTRATASPSAVDVVAETGRLNVVLLQGRMAGFAEERALPSGDVVATFRVVVERPKEYAGRQRVDVIDCAAWTPRLRKQVATWQDGDVVAIEGALRRRFFRVAGRTLSRSEVEVDRGRRLSRPRRPRVSD